MNLLFKKIILGLLTTTFLYNLLRPNKKDNDVKIKTKAPLYVSKYSSINKRLEKQYKKNEIWRMKKEKQQELREIAELEKDEIEAEKNKPKPKIIINDPNKELDSWVFKEDFNVFEDVDNEFRKLSEIDKINKAKKDSYDPEKPDPFTSDFKIEDLL